MELNKIYLGNSLEVIKTFDTESINCVITSPPYYKLRFYGIQGEIGQEDIMEDYLDNLINLFNEIHRVLKQNGTVFVNIGDTYNSDKKEYSDPKNNNVSKYNDSINKKCQINIKRKSLLMIP